ncbi:MAG: carboxypeptidase regulatory-like domain-containing protein [Longimicrobiales bacterium]
MSCLGLPGAVAAQQAQSLAPVTFAGKVVDTYWTDPVAQALVRLDGTVRADGTAIWGTTNDDGNFQIEGVPPGLSRVTVVRMGYADLIQVVDIREGQFLDIAMIPKPVVLEGIEVYVDRLESRIRELPYTASTFDEIALKLSPTLDVASYLEDQPAIAFVPCFENNSGTEVFQQRRDCMRARGTQPRRPSVYIDDAPAFGGLGELSSIPTGQVYRVEVIRGCGQIRVYTTHFVENVVTQAPRPLLPIIC